MKDKRGGRIVVVSHCILDVHCVEDDLALYPGMEEEVVTLLMRKGLSIYQVPCPEVALSGIFRKALPKDPYEHPRIRKVYREQAEALTKTLREYQKKGYTITAVIGAECSPTCGIDFVGRWKENIRGKKVFPRDVQIVKGRGVFMEEFQASLEKEDIRPLWIGIPGKTLRTIDPASFEKTLSRIDAMIDP